MFNKFSFRKKSDPGHLPDHARRQPTSGSAFDAILEPPTNKRHTPVPRRDSSPGANSLTIAKTHVRKLSGDTVTSNADSVAVEKDPLGLRVIHRPDGERKVDIVFVHGLGGSSRRTWSKDRDLDFFWPLKFLPFEPGIKDTRILSFGYNSDFKRGSGKTQMSVLDFAKNLLFELKFAQDDYMGRLEDLRMGERPIVFVVHSMGGLVVKEAYMQGQNDPEYETIVKAVSAIIFLSTPHRGTNLADTLNRILQVSFVSTAMPFIAELSAGSQTLQNLNEQFRHVAPKLDIVSFYETRPTAMLKSTKIMVLEKDSSVLGYPGEVSMPLDADHHEVCKYESREDPRYITVRNVLKNLIGKDKKLSDGGTNAVPSHVQQRSFEELLAITESPEKDYNFFRDRWIPGTCDWILDDPEFVSWLQEDRTTPTILWVHGNAASGKSVLSSFVIDHLVTLGFTCQYFFVRFEDRKKRAANTILRSLSAQLANALPAYGDRIRQLEASGADLQSQDHRVAWQRLYKQTFLQMKVSSPLYWIIDGVDEADSPRALINVFTELSSYNIPLRILLMSRSTHEISSGLGKIHNESQVLQIPADGKREDFEQYINHEIALAGDDRFREQIITEILERAQGNFLWVHLAVQKVNDCHTKVDVKRALEELPSGMQATYERMASSLEMGPDEDHPSLGEKILAWTTYAQRPLTIEELSDALDDDGILEIHRTIGDLCGGFVVVDNEGRVSLIHQTAREYLSRSDRKDASTLLNRRTVNDRLFRACITRLTDNILRTKINQGRMPALTAYATSAWAYHLSRGSATSSQNTEILLRFLQGPGVLTWIQAAAETKQLRALVVASRQLTEVVEKLKRLNDKESLLHRQAIETLTLWSTDLVKVVGKFGASLRQKTDAIYKLIPPFCPEDSAVFQQFGRKEVKSLQVSGFSRKVWDDCLARLSLEAGFMTSAVHAAGSRIAILTNRQSAGRIFVFNSHTFEEEYRLNHGQRVFRVQIDKTSTHLLSYGYRSTKIWDLSSGECITTIDNPPKRPRPQSIAFVENSNQVIVAGEDRCVRSFRFGDNSAEWECLAQIQEDTPDGTMLNAPICSTLSPDGDMIALGYRGHPVTVWQIKSQYLIGQCNMVPSESSRTVQENAMGEITQLAWHPFSGEVLGLQRDGLLFKWSPYDDEASDVVLAGAHSLCVSSDGSLVATGDTGGTIKVFTTADLSLIYQLSTQDPVLGIAFSADSRRLYDIRGGYGNVWEPNALIRLAESSEFNDHSSDSWRENESFVGQETNVEHHLPGIDQVVALSAQSSGQLYCWGTEEGVVRLGHVGYGEVREIERSTSFMSIEQIAWSNDGRYLAFVDLSGRLSLKLVEKSSGYQDGWDVVDLRKLTVPATLGNVNQLLFEAGSRKCIAITSTSLFGVDLETGSTSEVALPESMPKTRWACHPSNQELLLGFGSTKAYIFRWSDLEMTASHVYFPPRLGRVVTISVDQNPHGRGSFNSAEELLGRVMVCNQSADVILEISRIASSGRHEKQYLVFDTNELGTIPNAGVVGSLSYVEIPADIAARVREPLGMLSRRRLMFLDTNRWICTWRIPNLAQMPIRPSGGRGSDAGVGLVDSHYFLPGDWVTANETQMCRAMADGTVLCVRSGEVAAVQCMRLRR